MINLFNHQQYAVDNYREKNQILAHEMGLGKTITSISIGKGKKNLVVCPARLKESWVAELKKMGELSLQVVHTGKDVLDGSDWTIVSYSIAQKKYEELIEENFDNLFGDESHYIKGKFRYSKKLGKLSGVLRAGTFVLLAQHIPHVILTTGTPIMNKPIELWNQLMAVNADITKEMSRSEFSRRYCGGHLKQLGRFRFWWEGGATNLDELKEKIEDNINIVRKNDVLDLPEKVINRRVIEFSTDEQKEYDKAWDEYYAYIEQHPDYSLDDLKNVANAQQLVEVGKLRQVTSRTKVKAVIEDLENLAPGEQVVIFAEYVETIDTLNQAIKDLAKKQKKDGYAHPISHSTIKEKESVEKFQQGKVQVFTSNIIAGGTGLNLQNANMVWIIDENWTPAINQQAEDRIHRIGQEKSSFITYYEVFGTIDEKIRDANIHKRKIISKIMD